MFMFRLLVKQKSRSVICFQPKEYYRIMIHFFASEVVFLNSFLLGNKQSNTESKERIGLIFF